MNIARIIEGPERLRFVDQFLKHKKFCNVIDIFFFTIYDFRYILDFMLRNTQIHFLTIRNCCKLKKIVWF